MAYFPPRHRHIVRLLRRTPPGSELPDLYAQQTPRKRRLSPRNSKYWLSGYPELVAQWDATKNGDLFPDVVRYGSGRKVWWKCPAGPDHEWAATVTDRTAGQGCPSCAHRRVSVTNSLATLYPQVAEQWHATKNGTLRPEDVMGGSWRRVWWRCPEASDHVWETRVGIRTTGGRGCPFCSGNRVTRSNCLATLEPKVSREWHPTRNATLTPRDVTRGSKRRVWWQCKAGHEWQIPVNARTSAGQGCPYCAGQRATPTTSFAAMFPHLARDWHRNRNGKLTAFDVRPKSHGKVWWQCKAGHEWERSPASHARSKRCPFCSGERVSSANSVRALHPELVVEWDKRKNGEATPDNTVSGSHRRIWWRCAAHSRHSWIAQLNWRTRPGQESGCPHCWAKRRGQ